jgi:acid phosphatase type 7
MLGYMGNMKRLGSRLASGLLLLALFPVLETQSQTEQTPAPNSSKQTQARPKKKRGSDRTFVLVGAGDIAGCQNLAGAAATAKLIEQIPGTVFAAGDLAYESGSAEEFKNCYGPAWGQFKDRTRPALGNHEYVEPKASAYFQYWGAQAGPPGKGYYSYELGDWHIVVLNTNCYAKDLGGCGAGSPQEAWLKEDLAKRPSACILAYGHHALFSSGIFKKHAVHPELKQLWEDLYAAHADLVLAGHEHSYERFALQDPEGKADPGNGIREIVVGTGGRSHDLLGFAVPNSEVREWNTYGVLKLTLSPGEYSWEFIPEEGKNFHDVGSGACHNYPAESD